MVQWLKEWITLIVCNVLFITVVEYILPNNSIKKYCKFVLGLILIAVLMNPILKVFTNYDLITSIEGKEYIISEKAFEFDVKNVKSENRYRVKEVFNEKLKANCESFLNKNFNNKTFTVSVFSTIDEKSNKVLIEKLIASYKDKSKVKKINDINIGNEDNTKKNEEDERISTYLSDELKLQKNKIEVQEELGG